MSSNKYQKKKAATQSQIYTPTDKSKKSINITRTLHHHQKSKWTSGEGANLAAHSQLAIPETGNNLLKKKVDDLEAYSRRSCIHVNGLQKDDHENNDNLRKTVVENISSKTGISKDNIERSIDKLHRTGKYDQTTKTQPVIVKFTSLPSKNKLTLNEKL